MSTNGKIAVVTGANKGIGLETAKKLGQAGYKVVLACRNADLCAAAAAELTSLGADAECASLDITDQASVDQFAASMTAKHGKIDVLVNNVGMAFKGKDTTPFQEQAGITVRCNFFGTLRVTKAMLPLLKLSGAGRLMNMASESGHLKIIKGEALQAQFLSEDLTIDALEALMKKFITDVLAGTHEAEGWPNACLGTSKVGVVAMTRVLARAHPDLTVVCCCPGHCKTDMSSYNGVKSAEEGSVTPFFCATSDAVVTGKFYADEKEIEW